MAETRRRFPLLPRGIPYLTSLHYTNPTAELMAYIDASQIIHHINADNTLFLHGLIRPVKSRLVATIHQPRDFFLKIMPYNWRKYYERVDVLITLASKEFAYFSSQLKKANVIQIPHGNNNHLFSRSSLNPNLGICIGGWLRDHTIITAAMEIVKKKFPNFKVYIVTRRKPDNYSGDSESVKFKFNITDAALMNLYRNATMLILPLKDCTANNAVLESLASGIPIITNDVGGIKDYTNEKCAVLLKKGSPDALADKILYLLDNPDEIKKMSLAALKKSQEYDWPSITKKIVNEVYEN
jgi:glycosyltransferase involved in cell wall biosynthesis